MLKSFVNRPVATLMFVLVFVLLGVVSFPKMNVEENPSVDFPLVTTRVVYPGATADEIEEQAVKKLEDAVAEVPSIKSIRSEIYENVGLIITEFNLGSDVNIKLMEVKDKVDAARPDLPDAITDLVVEKLNPLQTAVITIAISSDTITPRDLYEYADETLKKSLTSIDGVASVDISGGMERAIRVRLNPTKMHARYISINDVIHAISMHNLNVPGGKIDNANTSVSVRFNGEFKTVDDIKNMMLTTADGARFPLSAVADITDGAEEVDRIARFNGRDAVLLSLIKATDGNEVAISDNLIKNWDKFKATLPAGINAEIISDSARHIRAETNDTINGIGVGILLTMIVLLLFTGSAAGTFIPLVVIPASMISAFFFMDKSGFSINSMTLLACATALGTLVANAIIIIESALNEMAAGLLPKDAAVVGTGKVFSVVLASSLTNVVVFLPIAFMNGIVGQFMISFGLSVVYLTLLSIVFSFILTPMMIGVFFKPQTKTRAKATKKSFNLGAKIVSGITKGYRVLFNALFKHPFIFIIINIALFMGGMKMAGTVGGEFMPETDRDETFIMVKTPLGSTISATQKITDVIESRLERFPEIVSITTNIGENGVENADLHVQFTSAKTRKRLVKELNSAIDKELTDLKNDAEITLLIKKSMGEGDLTLNVYGADWEKTLASANEFIAKIKTIDEVRSVYSSARTPKNEYKFIPNQAKMNAYGATNANVGRAIRAAIYGDDSAVFREHAREYKIWIDFDEQFRTDESVFSKIDIATPRGLVPLSTLGTIVKEPMSPNIKRRDRNRIVEVNITLDHGIMGTIQPQIAELAKGVDFADGGFYYTGSGEYQAESASELGRAFLLACILTFMVLAAILNSFMHPITIATTIITSFAGIFPVMAMLGCSMNISSMLAIVMVVGLVVNNAILVIEPSVAEINAGDGRVRDVLWRNYSDKMRAMLMSSIAIMAGMIPQLFSLDGSKVSMGAVMIGGMIGSLVFTMTLLPLLFVGMEKMKARMARQRK